jgi:hypothetical protein
VSWKVAEGGQLFSGPSQISRTLRFMVLDTLPSLAPVGRRPAGATVGAAGPVLWLVRHGESAWMRDPRLRERGLGVLEGTPSVDVLPALGGVAGDRVRVLRAYLRGVPPERMSWEPIGNGTVVRLPLQLHQHAYL